MSAIEGIKLIRNALAWQLSQSKTTPREVGGGDNGAADTGSRHPLHFDKLMPMIPCIADHDLGPSMPEQHI